MADELSLSSDSADELPLSPDMEVHKREIERAYKEGGSNKAVSYLRKRQGEWKDKPLHIGVTGRSGVGKSTLINTMRGLTGECPGAAQTDVTETTREAKAYPHPDNEKLVFWDLPGIGTNNFPKETYFKDEHVKFDRYDMFLILSSDRFFVDDYLLVKKAREMNKLFFFIRTKVDVAIDSQKKAKPSKFKNNPNFTEELLANIRAEVVKGMGDKSSIETSLFLIDCLDMTWTKYDLGKLIETLIDGFAGLKREAFILTLNVLSPTVREKKIAVLRKRIWVVSLISAVGAAVPIPGLSCAVDIALILEEALFYRKQLGISSKDISMAVEMFGTDVRKLSSELNLLTFRLSWTIEGMTAFMTQIEASEVAENIFKFAIPIIGSLIASTMNYSVTCFTLHRILKMIASDAEKLHIHMQAHAKHF